MRTRYQTYSYTVTNETTGKVIDTLTQRTDQTIFINMYQGIKTDRFMYEIVTKKKTTMSRAVFDDMCKSLEKYIDITE